MISIRQLTLGLATLYFFLLFASLLAGRWFWFYPAEIERQQLTQRQEVLSLQGIFDVQLESLKSRVLQLVVINNISTIKAADRKSTRLNSSHVRISYAVFCLKKKKK